MLSMGSARQIRTESVLLLLDADFHRFPLERLYENVCLRAEGVKDGINLKSRALQSDNRVFVALLHP